MSFSGGVYTLPGPALVTGEVVSATENNQFRNDVAGAFNLTMLRNGTSTATANLPMGGYKLTGLGEATTSGDALSYGQAAVVSDITATGSITVNSGTANGVAYLNGSKVLTTGSALTWNGSFLSVNGGIGAVNGNQIYSYNSDNTNYVNVSNVGATGSTNGQLAWTIGNVGEQMRLTSTGLGIGTSSPAQRLHLSNAGNVFAQIQNTSNGVNAYVGLSGASFTAGTSTTHPVTFITSDTERMRIDPSGNLGLGVAPSAWNTFKAFEIGNAGSGFWSSAVGDLRSSANTYYNSGYKYAGSNLATMYQQASGIHSWYTAPSGTAGNAISFTQAMTLDASGNLSLDGGGAFTLNNAKALAFKDSGGTSRWCAYMSGSVSPSSGNDLFFGNPLSANTVFFTNNTERMRIDSSGNVGIGTSSPLSGTKLTVSGAVASNGGLSADLVSAISLDYSGGEGRIIAQGSAGNSAAITFRNGASGSGTTERMRIDSSGNLLLGTTSVLNSNCKFNLVGSATTSAATIKIGTDGYPGINFLNNAGTQVGYIQVNTATTLYTSVSDYRLKENIQPMQNALARNSLLKPCTYSWKADGSTGEGFIAHELQAVCPDAVTGEKDAVDKDGKPVYQGVDTSFLVGHLVACINELKAELDATKAEVAALKGN